MVSAWPSIGEERQPWTSRLPRELISRRQRERHDGPYLSAVVPVIAELSLPLPNSVLALADEATVEIARFDAELGHEIAPFASVLLRSESASSSRIENLTSGAKAIAIAELGGRERRNATEIVGNVAAMTTALQLAERLDADAIRSMHAALLSMVEPQQAGRWREEQVWIGGTSLGPHDADFVPPHWRHIEPLIEDLLTFARRTDLPVLAQAAVAHAQFETIHPFADGNGRTGRALVHCMLRGHGLTKRVTLPVSAGLLTDTSAYFAALTDYRRGDPAPIVAQLADACFAAAANGRALVAELRSARNGWDTHVRARQDAAAWAIADLLLRQPVVDAGVVARELEIAPQNVQRAIGPLLEAGVLREFTGFRRNRMWECREVLDALDAFAARAGRRGG